MNTKTFFIAPITALLLGVGGAGLAATSSTDGATGMMNESRMMQSGDAPRMGQMEPGRMKSHGMMGGGMMGSGMMGGGMMGSGMMGSGMMGSCPMMSVASGANGKVMMQMHGEMMRAMGDIMIKYADKLEMPSSAK